MIRWGIIGAGKIAERFAKSLQHEADSELYAVSCRTLQKAQDFADKYHACIAYGNYKQLLEDHHVDAVYITLPHGFHYLWSIEALKHHKAVLVEKPAGINAIEIEGIQEVQKEYPQLWMEAMKTRFTPLYQKVKQLIDEDTIGSIVSMQATLNTNQPIDKISGTYLSNPVYGGALLDCGCYCATWITDYLTGRVRIDRVDADIQDGYDLHTIAQMHIGDIQVVLETAMNQPEKKEIIIQGTKGSIKVQDLHRPTHAEIVMDGQSQQIDCPYVVDDFYGEIHHFVQLLQQGKQDSDVMSIEDSHKTAMLLDRIKDASTPDPIEI